LLSLLNFFLQKREPPPHFQLTPSKVRCHYTSLCISAGFFCANLPGFCHRLRFAQSNRACPWTPATSFFPPPANARQAGASCVR